MTLKSIYLLMLLAVSATTARAADDLNWSCPKPGMVFGTSIGKWVAFGTGDTSTLACHYVRDGVDKPRYAGIYARDRARSAPEANNFWPLKNGAFLSFHGPGASGISMLDDTVRVTGPEMVTVPAGTFETMRIEFWEGLASTGFRGSGYNVTETFYWSPVLHFPVKHTVKITEGFANGLASDWELVSVEEKPQ
jgi:hypothetical protein